MREEARYLGRKVPPYIPSKLPVKIAFVAEAPSWQEVDHKIDGLSHPEPLVGPSGRMFNSMLRVAGIERDECYITNVFDEKIPDNHIKNWCAPLSEARANHFTNLPPVGSDGFLRPEYHGHLDRLQRELQSCQASVIVPLGGTALWALTGSTNIGSVRGTVVQGSLLLPGAKLLPTYHPSFVMKQFKYYSVVTGDLQKAKVESERGAEIILPKRELILEPTLGEIEAAIPRLLATSLLSVDIETAGGQVTCIGFAPSPEFALCIPLVDRRMVSRSYWPSVEDEVKAWGYIAHILASDTPKLGQNYGGYDFYWLAEKYHLGSRNVIHDTRLMQHAVAPELPKSLEFMQSYGSQGAWKYMGKHKDKRDD